MNYILKVAQWNKDKDALGQIRRRVFIEEQNVPEELEWDGYDEQATHILVTDKQNNPIGTARMKQDGHIGRMAVLRGYRKLGIGSKILHALISRAHEEQLSKVYLHAQVSAIPFYEKHGFITCSGEYLDAGIPHKTMELLLTDHEQAG